MDMFRENSNEEFKGTVKKLCNTVISQVMSGCKF